MPGLVYTFERDKGADGAALRRRPSTDAIIAIVVATGGMPRVHYEELTDSLNAVPVVAVVFAEEETKILFEKRLPDILRARALAVRRVAALEDTQSVPRPALEQ